jgi:HK97 family phage major capsid protein
MPTETQNKYNESLKKMKDFEAENGKDLSKYTPEAMKAYDVILGEADNAYNRVVSEDKRDKIEALKGQSAGSYVASFIGNEVPGKGEFPGLTADSHSGELYALDGAYKGIAEEKIAQLKSGAYKDAFANYIRTVGSGGRLDKESQLMLNNGSEHVMEAQKGASMKILAEGTDTGGGYWLPPDFRPELLKKAAVMATVRPDAKVYTTGTDHITFPGVSYNGSTVDDTYASLFAAGTRLSWRSSVGSTSDFTEATNPIAGQTNIPVNLATCAIILMREQVEDNSFDILGYINDIGGEALTLGEENAFTVGSGAGQPQGFANHPSMGISYSTFATVAGSTYWGNSITMASTTVVWGAAGSYGSTTTTTGLIGMEAVLPPQYEYNSKWYGSKFTFAAIRAINTGTATLPQWFGGDSWPNYGNGMNPSLLGYSFRKNQFIPSVTNATKFIYLGDMQGYYIVDRVGISVEVFREVYGLRDQVVVYMRKRVGGQLAHYWKLKVGTST